MRFAFPSVKNIVFAVNPSRLRFLFVLLVALIAFSFSTFAQTDDYRWHRHRPFRCRCPGCDTLQLQTDTACVVPYATNDDGQYVAPDLRSAITVKAEAKGFKVSEQKNVVLTSATAFASTSNANGRGARNRHGRSQSVQVQTDSGERSNLITDQQMSQIAVNGRSIYQLAALTPGASSQITGYVNTPVGGDASVEFNGMRQNHNIYLLDGGEDDDRGGAGGMSIAPSSDAIAEFRALTSNYSADYGLSSAGTMTMVLKSGTSEFHASAWEFNRNDYFDAINPFTNKSELRLNVYGFNVGGPVTFGHFYNPDKKRTFFFYNMEWRPLTQGAAVNQTVPGTNTYGGDFSSLLGGSSPNPIYVPTFGVPNAQVASSVLFTIAPARWPRQESCRARSFLAT